MMETSSILWIILFGALVTYLTRIGGHLVVTRVREIPPRVMAGLDAVPAAVLTTLVAPAALSHGIAEAITILVATLLALKLSMLPMFVCGAGLIILLRLIGI